MAEGAWWFHGDCNVTAVERLDEVIGGRKKTQFNKGRLSTSRWQQTRLISTVYVVLDMRIISKNGFTR